MRARLVVCAGILGMLIAPAQSSELTMMQTASLLSKSSATIASGKCSLSRQSLSNPDSLFPEASTCGTSKQDDEIIVVRSGDGGPWNSTPFGTTGFGSGTPFGKTGFASGTRFGRSNGFAASRHGTTVFARSR
jgi:hypothetical protein